MPKRKAKEDKWYFVEDPGNEDKVLKFPKRLQAFIEKEPTPYETHFVDHTDRFTGFKWKYRIQKTSPGNYCIDRGNTMVAVHSQSLIGQIIAVSELGVVVEKMYRYDLAKLGFFIHGACGYSRFDRAMILNARGLDDEGVVEKFNVKLVTMTNEVLADRLQVQVHSVPKGTYCVVVNVLPIEVGDELIVEHYGKDSLMPYGKPHYLDAQYKCFQAYEEAKKKRPIGRKVCKKCIQLLPKPKNLQHTTHNTDCKPYIWNFIKPLS
jgi:hypothetical protein